VALSEGVFIAGLGVPTTNAHPLRLATGGGGALRIRNLHDKVTCPVRQGHLSEGEGGGGGAIPPLAQPVPHPALTGTTRATMHPPSIGTTRAMMNTPQRATERPDNPEGYRYPTPALIASLRGS
jgi:hypothetical protein